MERSNFEGFWQVEQENTFLLAAPAVLQRLETQDRVISVIRHEGANDKDGVRLTWAGLNHNPVFDFCGGSTLSSFNLHSMQLNPRWVGKATIAAAMAIPTPRDLFGENYWDLMNALYVQAKEAADRLGLYHTRVWPHTPEMMLATISVYAKVFSYMTYRCRDECTLWDTSHGITRQITNLAHELFKDTRLVMDRSAIGYSDTSQPDDDDPVPFNPDAWTPEMGTFWENSDSTRVYLRWPKVRWRAAVVNRNSGRRASSGCFRTTDWMRREAPTSSLRVSTGQNTQATKAMCAAIANRTFLTSLGINQGPFHQW